MSTKESSVATLGEETAESAAQEVAAQATAKQTRAAKADKPGAVDAATQGLINLGFSGERRNITLPAARDESEQDFVFVSVNGVAFQIPRGKPFSVPVEVLEALDNAVETRYGRDGVGREVPRHQYSAR